MWASPVSTVSWEFIASKLEFSNSFIVSVLGSKRFPVQQRQQGGVSGVSRSRCGLLAAVLLQARGVRKGQRLREKLEEGEWASAAVRRLTPARRASAHPDMAAECSGRSERLREI